MRKIITLTLLIGFLLPFAAHAKKLQAFMSYATFYSPVDGPYIETYTTVVGKSVVFVKNANGKFQGTIEITLIFRQDSIIKEFKKYNLFSPEVDDTTQLEICFIDQQRFLLSDGSYDVEIMISDKNDNAMPFKANETIEVFFPSDSVMVSGIQLIESFKKTENTSVLTKSGYDLIPYILNYYPESISNLTFYAEVYNTDKLFGNGEKYLLSTYIESYETNQIYSSFIKNKKEIAGGVNVVFGEFDMASLPSGNFNIVIEVRNQQNELVTYNELFFQRFNPSVEADLKDFTTINLENSFVEKFTNKDTLSDYIKSLFPISSESERIYARNQIKRGELITMQQYFLNFWLTRSEHHPEGAWLKYNEEVQKVNAEFSTRIKRGYETDRGRVYLQFGPPNSRIQVVSEPDAYPYEIWHYYSLGQNQKNKRFVYYNPDMVSNDYSLIHSDAIGEIYDYRWKMRIYSRNSVTNDIDSDGYVPHWGSKAEEYYNNPR